MADKVWEILVEGGGTGTQAPDLEEVRRALAVLADPEHGVELRGLPSGRSRVYPARDLDRLVEAARELSDGAGVYWTLNPLRLGMPEQKAARVADVVKRRWLLLDIDRVKTKADKKLSSTDAQKESARALALVAAEFLAGQDWPAPVLVDSGNGWHLLYRIDLPCDKVAQEQLRLLLRGLAARLNTAEAEIDLAVHDGTRISKLPGTWARKGPDLPDRPWRMARLVHVPDPLEIVSVEQLKETLASLTIPASVGPKSWEIPVGSATVSGYGRKALESECSRLHLVVPGHLNNALRDSGFRMGQLVAAGLLDEQEAFVRLLEAIRSAGADDPEKDEDCLRRAIEAGKVKPRKNVPEPSRDGKYPASVVPLELAEVPDIDPADVATIDDLRKAGASVSWLWEGWIPDGVLTAIAAPGGTGKTRFCADLLRRIHDGLPWPDGSEMALPLDAIALWVVADNHHDEMVTLAETFGIESNIRINATKADPYGGVTLETPEDYRLLAARIKAVRPELVIIDTVGNATDRNLSKQEDAKAFYWPLQILARRYRCAILCLTHLNATGQFLGRRVLEKVRVALRMQQYEGDERRRLEIHKSNSKKPPALGVTMGDAGNEYDTNPPEPPSLEPGAGAGRGQAGRPSDKLKPCMDWLAEQLKSGPVRVGVLIDRAKIVGHAIGTLYRARDALGATEVLTEGRKWWRLTDDEEVICGRVP